MSLDLLKERLLSLHFGYFQPDDYLTSWINPDMACLLLEKGTLFQPEHITFGAGVHLDCTRSCLSYAMLQPAAQPYFGMALSRSFTAPYDFVHWVHSWNLLPDGSLVDPEPEAPLPVPPLYLGVEWCKAWPLIPKKPGASLVSTDELPEVLRRSLKYRPATVVAA